MLTGKGGCTGGRASGEGIWVTAPVHVGSTPVTARRDPRNQVQDRPRNHAHSPQLQSRVVCHSAGARAAPPPAATSFTAVPLRPGDAAQQTARVDTRFQARDQNMPDC
eukprot:1618558-Prymnesium_polylepis.2